MFSKRIELLTAEEGADLQATIRRNKYSDPV